MAVEEVSLAPGAVARQLGVAPETLRSWDRRYGVGPTRRSSGGHRRYAPEDVARLRAMCRLIAEGAAPAEAARVAAAQAETEVSDGAETRAAFHPPPLAEPVPAVPLPRSACQGLEHAATRMDAEAVERLLAESVAVRGTVATWEGLMFPALASVGAAWAATGRYVEVEHLLSWCVSSVLRRAPAGARRSRRPVLLTCTPLERHTLPLEALAAALAERGVPYRMLGPEVPAEATAAAIRRTAPSAVLVWARWKAGEADWARALAPGLHGGQREATRMFVAGPGWRALRLPASLTRLGSLPQAVELLAGDAGG